MNAISHFHLERVRFLFDRSAWIALMWLEDCPRYLHRYYECFSDN